MWMFRFSVNLWTRVVILTADRPAATRAAFFSSTRHWSRHSRISLTPDSRSSPPAPPAHLALPLTQNLARTRRKTAGITTTNLSSLATDIISIHTFLHLLLANVVCRYYLPDKPLLSQLLFGVFFVSTSTYVTSVTNPISSYFTWMLWVFALNLSNISYFQLNYYCF